MKKKGINPIWFLILGIAILVIPTVTYLCFLIPKMTDEYIVLMSSGGVIAGGGMFGASMIPDKTKFGALYKTASKSFTLLVVITLVKDFVKPLIGLAAVFIVSFIIFKIMMELWKDGKHKRENQELAAEVARSVTQATE